MNPNADDQPMLAELIADYLASRGQGTVQDGTEGNDGDIYVERLPANSPKGLYIASEPGLKPHQYLDTLMDGLTFYTRDKDGTKAYKRLVAVMRILHRAHHFDIGDLYVYFAQADAGIAYVDTDLNGGMIYSLGMSFIYRDKNVIS